MWEQVKLPEGYDRAGMVAAMEDVREFGRKTRREKVIGVRPDGTRAFEVEGSDHAVECPHDLAGKEKDIFIVHCHPGDPTPLSYADLTCIWGMSAAGNMAVACDDDTVSWSHGLTHFDAWGDFILTELTQKCIKSYFSNLSDTLADNDDRWVPVGDKFLCILVKGGVLKDLYVHYGEKAKAALAKYRQGADVDYVKEV